MTKPTPPKPLKATEEKLPDVIVVSELSEDSQEILRSFGVEAPAKLNDYAIALEDALIEQVNMRSKDALQIKQLKARLSEFIK